jgi:Flp pilus assembly secretin CpaC
MSVGCQQLFRLPLVFLAVGLCVLNSRPAFSQWIALDQAKKRIQPAQDVQVQFDVRIISVAEDGLERIGVDFECRPTAEAGRAVAQAAPDTLLLTEKQQSELLESMAGNARMKVESGRRHTLAGQPVSISFGNEVQQKVRRLEPVQGDGVTVFRSRYETIHPGVHLDLLPLMSEDRHSVQVRVKMAETTVRSAVIDREGGEEPAVNVQLDEKTVVIPDGGTALLFGPKKTVETHCEYGPPMLSRIPYLNRLFKNVGCSRETQQLIVMVTPHIVAAPEDEELKARAKTPPEYPGLRLGSTHLEKIAMFELTEECAAKPETKQTRMGKAVANLVKAYREACAAGQTEEAEKLARAALLLDPTCFATK